tara:strand:- start:103 stop:387 length:285 start_codon:yes stop_codon:yes gene_type:complete
MNKILIAKIICLTCIFPKTLLSGDTEKIIQSNILGVMSSLIMPAKASAVISLLPYISDTKIEEIENASGEKIVLKNNSSVNYTNSINYINSLAE